jgi:hypothetical protein
MKQYFWKCLDVKMQALGIYLMPFYLHIFFGCFLRDRFKLYPSPSLPLPVNIHVPVLRILQITPL